MTVFIQTKHETISEIEAEVYYYKHSSSGGTVIWVANSDPNRAFGIGFKTPPTDSTGVAHILEHAVLAGSRKYPVKDPFMAMNKTSMSTFLNAMTYADMTCYPVASMNNEDFHHLMDVYLDAVFYPKLLTERKIFEQEGYHKEIYQEDEPICYNGIVYNEMRGVYSNPDRTVIRNLERQFHPGSTYSHESGGYPYDIPTLSYDDCLAFHKQYYRPDNALVVLYGDIDIERALKQIDRDYFAHFTATTGQASVVLGERQAGTYQETSWFDGDETMTIESDSYLTYTVPFSKADNAFETFLIHILADALVESEASPLYEALVGGGYCQELTFYTSGAYYQDFSLILERINPNSRDEIVNVIETTLSQVVTEGVNPELLKAALNHNEFQFRKLGGAERGVSTFIQLMYRWRYCQNEATDTLKFSQLFKDLRAKIQTDFYTSIVRERLLQPTVKQIMIHQPKFGLNQSLDNEMAATLEKEKASLTCSEIQALISANHSLKTYQEEPDSPEALATLPQLTLADIEPNVTTVPEERRTLSSGQTVLFHEQPTAGIRYLQFAFPLTGIQEDEIALVSDLATFLGSVATKSHTYGEIEIALDQCVDNFNVVPRVYLSSDNVGEYTPYMLLRFATIGNNSERALELAEEILTTSCFDDIDRIHNILERVRTALTLSMDDSGHTIAMEILAQSHSQGAKYADYLGGRAYYSHLCELLDHWETKHEKYLATINALMIQIFNASNAVVSITSELSDREILIESIQQFFNRLPQNTIKTEKKLPIFELTRVHHLALSSNTNVQYVVAGGTLQNINMSYSGKMAVLSNIVSKEILYDQLRIQGGAYGHGLSISSSGDVAFYSYRDPHLKRTLEVYHRVPMLLQHGNYTQDVLDQFIIGTMTRYQFPVAPQNVSGLMLQRYLKGTTTKMLQERMREALSTTTEDVHQFSRILQQILDEDHVVVYGNDQKIKENNALFDTITSAKQKMTEKN